MVTMLSIPKKDFLGGELMSWEVNEKYLKYDLLKGDSIIFPSHKYHSVTPLREGERFVFVIELWEGEKGDGKYRTGSFGHLVGI